MFEKEAEEYGLQQALWCTSDSGDLRDTFKDGAVFGYNKANEWHYPSKGGKMTKYEELMNKSDECCLKAIEFARKGDWNMATFWKKASIEYKEKAWNLQFIRI